MKFFAMHSNIYLNFQCCFRKSIVLKNIIVINHCISFVDTGIQERLEPKNFLYKYCVDVFQHRNL